MTEEQKKELIKKYRTEIFETDSNDISEIVELTKDDSEKYYYTKQKYPNYFK